MNDDPIDTDTDGEESASGSATDAPIGIAGNYTPENDREIIVPFEQVPGWPLDRAVPQSNDETLVTAVILDTYHTCDACGAPLRPFDHPEGWLACEGCGTLERGASTLRADYTARVSVLAPGGSMTIDGPFRGMRTLATLRTRNFAGTYLLERAGAVLLMQSLGLALAESDAHTLTFIKD